MKSMVLYGTRYGNTQSIAEAIASVLQSRGEVRLLAIEQAPLPVPADVELLVIGGPTEVHGVTPQVMTFLDALGANALHGKTAAAFDTRIKGPRWLSGSAALGIAHRLRAVGARMIVPAESFLVHGKDEDTPNATLEPGELKRAEAWAADVADKAAAALFEAPALAR